MMINKSICPAISFVGLGKFGAPLYDLFKSKFATENTEITKAELVFIMVRPEQVDGLITKRNEDFRNKLLINFTPKNISTKHAMIHVACLPVQNGLIQALTYKENSQVTEEQLSLFLSLFEQVTNYINGTNDPVGDLGVMSRIFVHLTSYCKLIGEEGHDLNKLSRYFEFATKSLAGAIDQNLYKAATKGGITESLKDGIKKGLGNLHTKEKEIVDKVIGKISKKENF